MKLLFGDLRACVLGALLVGALLFAGCGSDNEKTPAAGNNASSDSGQKLLDDERLPPAPKNLEGADVAGAQQALLDGLGDPELEPEGEAFDISKVDKPAWFIQAAPSIAVTVPVGPAFADAGRAAGVETHECPGRSTTEGNAICIDQAIQAGAGSLVIFSIDPARLSTYLKKARDAGIKIISGNNALRIGDQTEPNTDASVSHDYYGAGYLNGLYAVAALGGDVDGLCISIPDFKVTVSVCKGFADAVHKYVPDAPVKEEGITVARFVEDSTTVTNSAVLGNPNLNFIMNSIDDSALPVIAQLKRMNKKPGEILLGGQNGTVDALQRIANKDFQVVTAGQNVNWWGWAFFDGAARAQVGAIDDKAHVTAPNKVFTVETFKSDGPFKYENANELYGFTNDGEVFKKGYEDLWKAK
jgi:ribose transport system substrate-binding protein